MKIIQFTCENVKKLTAVRITPEGNLVQITGKNGQGKSSVLDAIFWALAGTANVQSQPVRQGADSAKIELALGDGKTVELFVERKLSVDGNHPPIIVRSPDGARYPSPQKMLDDLLGALTFDPLLFMREGGRGQFGILRKLVRLDVDPEEIDKENKADFDKRTLVNRDARAVRAQADGIKVTAGLPQAPIDETALLDAIQSAASENQRLEQRIAQMTAHAAKIVTHRADAARFLDQIAPSIAKEERISEDQCTELQVQIDGLLRRIAVIRERTAASRIEIAGDLRGASNNSLRLANSMQAELDKAGALPAPTDLVELRARLDTARIINGQIAQRAARAALETRAESFEEISQSLTRAIEDRNASKAAAMAKATMPIEGLAFGDGVVLYRELPLDQASDAEQLMVSTAIAAALNPKLRVLRIRDGSLLDADSMKSLAQFADAHDMQIWIERVDSSGAVGIVMEDGHVKGAESAHG